MGLTKRSMPDLTIEPDCVGSTDPKSPVYKVIEHGVYESGSVLGSDGTRATKPLTSSDPP